MGGVCGTITLPTFEEAPPFIGIWLRQRTRWMKGWLQTIAVHASSPVQLTRDLGWRSSLFFHLVLTSIVVSMLIHPFFLMFAGYRIAGIAAGETTGIAEQLLTALAMFNFAGGYATYGCFVYAVHRREGLTMRAWHFLSLPLYWLLISLAGWRALAQLLHNPFLWEKTPHGLANSDRQGHMLSKPSSRTEFRRNPWVE